MYVEQTDARIVRRCDLFHFVLDSGIRPSGHRKLHIGLAARNPYVSSEHVLQSNSVCALYLQFERSACVARTKVQAPMSQIIRVCLLSLAAKNKCDRFVWRSVTPDVKGNIPLNHHMICENGRQANLCADDANGQQNKPCHCCESKRSTGG